MPLNKLDNFIKNTEGRILYVSPSDLDSTDTIDNQGNSLARPFKTLQRALIESARFSYVKGNSNDIIEKTTILLMPGEHTVDNRPGLAIYADGNEAKVRTKNDKGAGTLAKNTLNLDLNSNFDITQGDNILYKFNSVDGGVIVPRGTSVVGLDLRKTKIRPKYVASPTDDPVPTSSIFKVTGSCYFWQFSIFDGNDLDLVYTDNNVFTSGKQAFPTFSHNKLTVFEYCDGVNNVDGYDSNDLDMYYYKVGNAYNEGSTRPIENTQKYPLNLLAFEPQRPEWEIVGAFATDAIRLSKYHVNFMKAIKTEFVQQAVKAKLNKDQEALRAVKERVKDLNRNVDRKDKIHGFIDSVSRSFKQLKLPAAKRYAKTVPKDYRKNAQDIAKMIGIDT